MAETEFSLALEEEPESACNQHAISMRSSCNQYAISMQSVCDQHAISMQSACNQHAISMQSACNQHAISMRAFEEREQRRDAARVDNRDAILGRI